MLPRTIAKAIIYFEVSVENILFLNTAIISFLFSNAIYREKAIQSRTSMPKVYDINITIKSDDYSIVLHVLSKVSYSSILQLLIQQAQDISVCSDVWYWNLCWLTEPC